MRVYDYSSQHTSKFIRRIKRYFHHTDWKKVGTWLFRITAAGVLILAFLFIYFSRSLPDPNRLLGRNVPQSTKIYDRNGGLLYEVHGEVKRTLVNLDEISPYVPQATVAIEDKNFYKHGGISVTGILRSIYVDITHASASQGGSTITQQFVKNAVLTNEKSLWRKLKEIILSIEIEARFSKQDILKLYLNEIPYGRNAYGIEAAAQSYFNKHAKDLDLAESAYLAALPQAPTHFNPSAHLDLLTTRQHTVLQAMKDQGYINDQQYQQAINEQVHFVQSSNSITAPHFVQYVEDYLAQKYGEISLQQGGLKVYTSLDPDLQKIAEDAIKTGVDKFSKRYNANNAALVAVDPKTGQILAMVGSKDYFADPTPAGCTPGKNCTFEPNFNVATSPRQPGSSFKPYVYVTAFGPDFKYSPSSMLVDVTTNFGTFAGKAYIPHNYNGQSYGPLPMRSTLAGSLNVPAVKTLALVGVDNATKTAHDLGITSPLQNCGLSLVLGGCEVKLIDHVAAYAAIANEGDAYQKTAIMKVLGEDGKTLEEYSDQNHHQVIDPQAAYELISIMTDNNARAFIFGAGSPLAYSRPVGCKTGTTQNFKDGWTLCYTPSIAIGVWAGNNDGTLLKSGADGVVVAAPIVNQVMKAYLKDKPVEEFTVPQGITKVTVDALSGKLPGDNTPETRTDTFADYSVPTDHDTVHSSRQVDSITGLPADSSTPPQNIITQPCLNLHSERPDNPNWENPVLAYAAEHGGCSGSPNPDNNSSNPNVPQVSINQPQNSATLSSTPFTVSVSASGSNPIARVDLAVDGQTISTSTSAPYNFTVSGHLEDGSHIITAHVVDNQGASADTSSTFNFSSTGQPFGISTSGLNTGSPIVLPQKISAVSGVKYSSVTFYYQTGGTTKTIGSGSPTSNSSGGFQYSATWNDKAKPGDYKIFAKSNTGATTAKVDISVGQ